MGIYENLSMAEEMVGRGDIDRALSLLKGAPYVNIIDGELHQRIAHVLLAAGNISLAVKELELAARDSNDPTAFLELSSIDIDNGDIERAERRLRKALKKYPMSVQVFKSLGKLYETRGDVVSAKRLYESAYEVTGEDVFKRLLSELSLSGTKELRKSYELLPEDIHLVRFVSLFSGREGVYARQWIKGDGSTGYSPVKEPFTVKVARNHILGNYTVGIYQLRYDNTVNFVTFDIDVPKVFLPRFLSSEKEHERISHVHLEVANAIVERSKSFGIDAYLEESGFKGKHVWIFFEFPITAFKALRLCRGILSSLGELPQEVDIEIFPKQTFVRRDGLGALVKLPLGVHLRSGKRSLFIGADGNPVSDQLSYLLSIKRVEKDLIEDALKAFNGAEVVESVALRHGEKVEEEFSLEDDVEFGVLANRCPVISALYEKCRSGRGLTGDEISVIVFTLGNLTQGVKIVNTLLSMAGVFNKRAYLKSKLNGNPMSCAKIRKRIPHITSNVCRDCFSGKDVMGYPTPLLHLKEIDRSEADVEVAAMEYLDVYRKFCKLKVEYETLRSRLVEVFIEHGISELRIGKSRIRVDGTDIVVEVDK